MSAATERYIPGWCVFCQDAILFDRELVPTVRLSRMGGFLNVPDPNGRKEAVCRRCAIKLNEYLRANGLRQFRIANGAYRELHSPRGRLTVKAVAWLLPRVKRLIPLMKKLQSRLDDYLKGLELLPKISDLARMVKDAYRRVRSEGELRRELSVLDAELQAAKRQRLTWRDSEDRGERIQ